MKYDVLFSDNHVETVEVEEHAPYDRSLPISNTTIAEVAAVGKYPGYAWVVRVTPHVEMVDLDPVPRSVIDYIQRVYDELPPAPDPDTGGWRRGVEFVVLQLGLPIKLGH